MAMFPPALPHVFIQWLTAPGDVVYDPFSGRGTTGLEACLLRREGLLSDANPLAVVLSGAKVDPPRIEALQSRLGELEQGLERLSVEGQPDAIAKLFSRETLGDLLWLRAELDPLNREDRYLLALLLGGLHARRNTDGSVAGLTVPMPNTFAMSPGYIHRFVEAHGLVPPKHNVIEFLRIRLRRFPPPESSNFTVGAAWKQDAGMKIDGPLRGRQARLIFTSPPYLQVVKYGKQNWIRLWLLGADPASVDRELAATSSLDRYTAFMQQVVSGLRNVMAPNGYLCLVLGNVVKDGREVNLAEAIEERSLGGTDLRAIARVNDDLPAEHKVSRIWGKHRGNATRRDRIIILGTPESPSLPPIPALPWIQPA